jgi:hypothetical protein
MAGALDSVFKQAAKAIVADLGDGLDTKIDYTRKFDSKYNTSTGTLTTFDRPYIDLKCPIEFIRSEEEEGREEREARIYVSPDQIGNNQPTMQDEITLKFAGASHVAHITDINTYRGGQEYLYILRVMF